MKLLVVAASLALGLFIPLSTSLARDDTPDDRPAAPGFASGAFRFTPSVAATEEYNSNIYTEDDRDTGDFITRIIPRIHIESEGQPYRLEANAKVEQLFFADETQNDYLNASAGAKYHAKLDPSLAVDVSGAYARLHALPGDDEADPGANASEPISYSAGRYKTGLTKELGGFTFMPQLGLKTMNYESVARINGTRLDEGFRDRREYMAGGRVGYKIDGAYEIFTDFSYTPIAYSRGSPTDRDSKGGDYLAGLRYKPSKDLSAEFAAGYMNRDYRRQIYDDIGALDIAAKVSWFYADKSAVTASFNRSIGEVTDAGVGGAIYDSFKAGISKQLDDDWSVKAEGGYTRSDYQGGHGATDGKSRRENNFYQASLKLNYALNRYADLIAQYMYNNYDSNREISDYAQNVIMFGVKAEF